jgi:GH25 family lysozyme M1 (1,4-beta-N-acetylmuramidase)
MANAIGPDVSFYQDDPETERGIDFVKMAAPADFVIIRTGQNLWVDPSFKMNWREAGLAGLPRGSYWFYDSRVEPKRQAELWVQQFAGDFGELPLFADFEEAYGGIYKGWKNWYTFLERVKSLVGGKEIGIYTAFFYWRDNAPAAGTANLEYFHQYPLWIANYAVTKPAVPKPWASDEWLFWQFTEGGDGKLYGVESNGIDLNHFNGTLAQLKARFQIPDPIPPPPPPPDDGGTPTGRMYKVTASALKVRKGPGLSYDAIGLLYLDEVVEEIGATADRTWLRVRRSDGGLSGWSFAEYLQNLTPPPPPPDDGGTPTGKMYRVIASALNIREAPDVAANSVGLLPFGEIVEEIGANTDRSWLRIRQTVGSLRGWCFASFLQDASNPPPPPPPPDEEDPQSIPGDETRKWYRVTSSTLSIRMGPNGGAKIIGAFAKEDSVAALDDTSNAAWIQVRRIDGLTGWCEKKSLSLRSVSRPASFRQKIFTGVFYSRKELLAPRKNVIHAIGIDLQTAGLDFLVTPPSTANGILCTRTTSKFLKEFGMSLAINADGFSYLDPAPANVCAEGDPVIPNGYAVSRRKTYSVRKTADPIIYFNQRNQVTINQEKGQVVNAVSGDRLIVDRGKTVKNLAAAMVHPRTALGLNKVGRNLILVVVDGRQPGYSEGMTLPELANEMVSFGAFTAVNMDGGSSSTMVLRGINGQPLLVNKPIELGIPGKQSPVANHLGVLLKNG